MKSWHIKIKWWKKSAFSSSSPHHFYQCWIVKHDNVLLTLFTVFWSEVGVVGGGTVEYEGWGCPLPTICITLGSLDRAS